MKINLNEIRICSECGILFKPKEPWYHTCPHCYEPPDRPSIGDLEF